MGVYRICDVELMQLLFVTGLLCSGDQSLNTVPPLAVPNGRRYRTQDGNVARYGIFPAKCSDGHGITQIGTIIALVAFPLVPAVTLISKYCPYEIVGFVELIRFKSVAVQILPVVVTASPLFEFKLENWFPLTTRLT